MIKEAALHQFWSSFGLKAYDENTVIDSLTNKAPTPPYIVYDVATDNINAPVYLNGTVIYRPENKSWLAVTEKVHEIESYIGRTGVFVPCDGGALWIHRGNPFAQRIKDNEDETVRKILLNIIVEYITEI